MAVVKICHFSPPLAGFINKKHTSVKKKNVLIQNKIKKNVVVTVLKLFDNVSSKGGNFAIVPA